MGSKSSPGAHDCYAAALPDEPLFTLLGRDPLAPLVVAFWAKLRSLTRGRDAKVQEAVDCGLAMAKWHAGSPAPRSPVTERRAAVDAFDHLVHDRAEFEDVALPHSKEFAVRNVVLVPREEYEALLRAADQLARVEELQEAQRTC